MKKKPSQKESGNLRWGCCYRDSFQHIYTTIPLRIQDHLTDQKPRWFVCHCGQSKERTSHWQKQEGFYISIIWCGSSFLRGYRFPATDSRCGSSQGCTRWISFGGSQMGVSFSNIVQWRRGKRPALATLMCNAVRRSSPLFSHQTPCVWPALIRPQQNWGGGLDGGWGGSQSQFPHWSQQQR